MGAIAALPKHMSVSGAAVRTALRLAARVAPPVPIDCSYLPAAALRLVIGTFQPDFSNNQSCGAPPPRARGFWSKVLPGWAAKGRDAASPPHPAKQPRARSANGYSWTDDYAWFEDMGPPFMQHLRAEQRHYEAWRQPLAPMLRQLGRELAAQHEESQV